METSAICPWCQKSVFSWQWTANVDGDTYHTVCAMEDEEDAHFDRDMGFGDDR